MAYGKKAHLHKRQVKVLLNEDEFFRLKACALRLGEQHSVLSREILKAVIEVFEETGELPEWIERKFG